MKTHIQATKQNLATAEAFFSRFPGVEEIIHDCSIYSFEKEPQIEFYCTDASRDRILGEVGKLFGTSGWVTKDHYSKMFLDWTRTIDNVEITIVQAQKLEVRPVGTPVPPQLFPLQLQ